MQRDVLSPEVIGVLCRPGSTRSAWHPNCRRDLLAANKQNALCKCINTSCECHVSMDSRSLPSPALEFGLPGCCLICNEWQLNATLSFRYRISITRLAKFKRNAVQRVISNYSHSNACYLKKCNNVETIKALKTCLNDDSPHCLNDDDSPHCLNDDSPHLTALP